MLESYRMNFYRRWTNCSQPHAPSSGVSNVSSLVPFAGFRYRLENTIAIGTEDDLKLLSGDHCGASETRGPKVKRVVVPRTRSSSHKS